MQNESSTSDFFMWAKIVILWLAGVIGSITASQIVLFATFILTCLQGYRVWLEIQVQKGKLKTVSEKE